MKTYSYYIFIYSRIQWIVDGVPSARQDIRNQGISESAVIPTTDTGSYTRLISLLRETLPTGTLQYHALLLISHQLVLLVNQFSLKFKDSWMLHQI